MLPHDDVLALGTVLVTKGRRAATEGWLVVLGTDAGSSAWSGEVRGATFRPVDASALWFPTRAEAATAVKRQLAHVPVPVLVRTVQPGDLRAIGPVVAA